MSERITPRHLARQAILYVRQSSPGQVLNNEESRLLQYAMQDKLRSLGWSNIEVIDDDLGRTATGVVQRAGFERMVAEVSLGKTGVVAARELSRFARNSREWQQLIEVCRFVDTLLIDQDSVYDPRQSNDRLLLGLKGSMSEYEIELLRLRGNEAKRAKAARGELFTRPAVGYFKTDDDRLEKDPDLRVQQVLRLMFDKVFEFGSVYQAMHWFLDNELQIPVGRRARTVLWRPVMYSQFIDVVTNPIYAGAYAFGRTEVSYRIEGGKPRRVVIRKQMQDWSVLIRDHHEGYVTWDEFERIQSMIAENAQKTSVERLGAPKHGVALMAGLVRCRRCARGLLVGYSGDGGRVARYTCTEAKRAYGAPRCISFSAIDIDAEIGRLVLEVVQPGAVEAARLATEAHGSVQDELLAAVETELEAARYTAERARRQFDASDPENRLVTGELERRWNVALTRVQEVERRLGEARESRDSLEMPNFGVFGELATNLEKIWNDTSTDIRLKKRIVRTLIEKVIVDVDDKTHEIVCIVHWKGDAHTELRVRKRRRGEKRTSVPAELDQTIRDLALIFKDQAIASSLERGGVRTARGGPWTRELVTTFRSKHDIPLYTAPDENDLDAWVSLSEAAAFTGVAWKTLHGAIERKELVAKHPLTNGPWIVRRRDVANLPLVLRLQERARQRGGPPLLDPKQLNLGITKT